MRICTRDRLLIAHYSARYTDKYTLTFRHLQQTNSIPNSFLASPVGTPHKAMHNDHIPQDRILYKQFPTLIMPKQTNSLLTLTAAGRQAAVLQSADAKRASISSSRTEVSSRAGRVISGGGAACTQDLPSAPSMRPLLLPALPHCPPAVDKR